MLGQLQLGYLALEVPDTQTWAAFGMGYDRAIDAGLTINRSLGRHPNDRMLSFYATTPSGFDLELGWGGAKVDDAWPTAHYDHISAWGHRKLGKVVADRG